MSVPKYLFTNYREFGEFQARVADPTWLRSYQHTMHYQFVGHLCPAMNFVDKQELERQANYFQQRGYSAQSRNEPIMSTDQPPDVTCMFCRVLMERAVMEQRLPEVARQLLDEHLGRVERTNNSGQSRPSITIEFEAGKEWMTPEQAAVCDVGDKLHENEVDALLKVMLNWKHDTRRTVLKQAYEKLQEADAAEREGKTAVAKALRVEAEEIELKANEGRSRIQQSNAALTVVPNAASKEKKSHG